MYIVYRKDGQAYLSTSLHAMTDRTGYALIGDAGVYRIPNIVVKSKDGKLLDFLGNVVQPLAIFESPMADNGLYVTGLVYNGSSISINMSNKSGNSTSNITWVELAGPMYHNVPQRNQKLCDLGDWFKNVTGNQVRMPIARVDFEGYPTGVQDGFYYLMATYMNDGNSEKIVYHYEQIPDENLPSLYEQIGWGILYVASFPPNVDSLQNQVDELNNEVNTVSSQVESIDNRLSGLETSTTSRFVSR